MATRYGLTGTVAAAGAAILAVLIALSPSERAQSLGLTQHGALITAQDAGAADAVATVAVSPGTAGQVLTVSDAGLPHWAAAAGGGGGDHSSGTYASRPGTCALGDTYTVSSGARTGSVYRCAATDTWRLDEILPPTSVAPLLWWDTERLEPHVGQTLAAWRAEGASGALVGGTGGVSAQPSVLAAVSAWGGLPAASWGSGAGCLVSTLTGPLRAGARTLVVVASAVDTSTARSLAGWGRSAAGLRTFTIRGNVGGYTGLSFYGTDPTGSVAAPTTSTPAVLVATYTGTHYALRQAAISASPSWAYSVSAATATLDTYAGGLTVGCHAWDTGNAQETLVGRIHWVGVYTASLSESESNALAVALHTRLQ